MQTETLPECNFVARLAAGNVRDQFVAVLDLLSVHRKDGVADFQASAFRRASGYYAGNRDSRLHAVHSGNGRVFLCIEFDSNRTALHPVFGAGELVVNLHHGV